MRERVICMGIAVMLLITLFNFNAVFANNNSNSNIAENVSEKFMDNPMSTDTVTVESVVGDGAQIIGLNGKIYCFGTELTLIYDINSHVWSSASAMPVERIGYAISEINDNIYLIGGIATGETNASSRVDIFNTTDLTWNTVADIPYAVYDITSNVVGNKIYCVGKYSDMFVFDTLNMSWSSCDGLPDGGVYTSAVVGSDIYYTGAETQYGNKSFVFNTIRRTWKEVQPRPNYDIDNTAVGKYKLLNFENNLLCLEYGGDEKLNSKVRYVYVPTEDTWIILPDKLPDLKIGDSAFTMYNNQIFVFTDGTYSDGTTKSRLTVMYFINHESVYSYNDTIAVGYRHILNYSNGVLMAKGDNTYGQLGDGTTNSSDEFVAVQMPWVETGETVCSVVAGGNMSYVITDKYNLYAWGQNDKSQLGNGSMDNVTVPTLVAENVVKAAAGESHTIILKRDTSVWTSGNNTYGQLGNNSTSTKRRFTKVAENAADIETGRWQSYIIDFDGNLKGCGSNIQGALGIGSVSMTKVFTDVISNIRTVSSGITHSVAVDKSGGVYVWGSNAYGQLGLPENIVYQITPYKLTNIINPEIAKAGGLSTVYVSGGLAYQSGYMGHENKHEFINITNVSNISEIAVCDIVFAKNLDGEIFSWGLETYSQKFDISRTNIASEPIRISDLAVNDLDSKRTQTLAIDNNGYVIEWGRGYFGIGSDQEEVYSYPISPKDMYGNDFMGFKVKRGKNHNLVVCDSGSLYDVYGWGSNTNYPLGRSNGSKVRYPIATSFCAKYLEDEDGYEWSDHMIYDIAAGAEFSIGSFNDVRLVGATTVDKYTNTYAMGKGYTDKPNSDGNYSESALIGAGYEYIDAGYNFVVAIDNNHHTVLWGDNEYGQLAKNCSDDVYDVFDGSYSEYFTEVKCGPYFCIGLTNNGNVYSWGKNSMGQLGLGYVSAYESDPKKINGLSNVISVGVGHDHAMAVKADGTVWTWGNNSKNQLGRVLGSTSSPGQVLGITNAKEVTGGYEYTVIVDNDNHVWTVGSNEFGALGIYRTAAKEVNNGIGEQYSLDIMTLGLENDRFSLREFMKSDETTVTANGYVYERINGAIRRRRADV